MAFFFLQQRMLVMGTLGSLFMISHEFIVIHLEGRDSRRACLSLSLLSLDFKYS